jgi:hypothetical protein
MSICGAVARGLPHPVPNRAKVIEVQVVPAVVHGLKPGRERILYYPFSRNTSLLGDIEVPTLGPAQDPLGIKTSVTEFPCGGPRPVSHTATTEGAPHAYAIPIGTRMENPAWKVDKVCTKSGWLAQPKHRVIDLTK